MRTSVRLVGTAALLVAGLSVTGVAHAQPAEPGPPPAPPAPKTLIEADGTYRVGVDIMPGTYTSGGPVAGIACYWKRAGGEQLIDNALTKKPQTVRIEVTDTAFTTSHCQPWQLAACGTACPPPPPPPGPQGLFGDLRRFLGPNQFAVPLP